MICYYCVVFVSPALYGLVLVSTSCALQRYKEISLLLTVSNFTFTDHVVGCTTQVQVGHMFEEVNYIQEGQNAERFGRLYGLHAPYSK